MAWNMLQLVETPDVLVGEAIPNIGRRAGESENLLVVRKHLMQAADLRIRKPDLRPGAALLPSLGSKLGFV